MAGISMGLRFKSLLVRRPVLANRLLRIVGGRGIQRLARRIAVRAARQAFERVPFYRAFYERGGFDKRRLRRLSWADFGRLPTVGKAETPRIPARLLLDHRLPFPA